MAPAHPKHNDWSGNRVLDRLVLLLRCEFHRATNRMRNIVVCRRSGKTHAMFRASFGSG